MRVSLYHFAFVGAIVGWTLGLAAQPSGKQLTLDASNQASSHTSEVPPDSAADSAEASLQSRQNDDFADPVADPTAVVTLHNARFTVLTPELIRMEWAADGKFEDHASFAFLNRRLPVPKFEHHYEESGKSRHLIIKTTALTLTYNPTSKPGVDNRFTPENLSIQLTVADKLVVWRPGVDNPENLQGTTRTLDGALGEKTKEPIEQGLISRSGWAVVDDSSRPLFDSPDFSFKAGEKSPWPWVIERPAGDRQDWYFFGYGHDYRKALGDFVRVAGRIPLPPRFAFGAWWSRYWAYSDQEIEEIIRGFRENDTPLDVFVIDMDWHISHDQLKAAGQMDQANQRLGWTGYTWNKLLFPDPDQFLARLHAEGLKTSLNLHPASGVHPWEQAYPAMAHAMGIDPATKKHVPFDITDKKFATNYLNLLHHPLEKQGIDFWWLDWQQEPTTKLAGVNPTWWLNYVHFTDQQREGKRPLLFHRWGGLGNHRYQIGFSGDTVSVWPSLAFQPWFTATAANVGYAYWSHDIGGHMPGAVEPELYTRWVQFGAFSPILRTHTTKNPTSERRIWAYPEPFASILRSTFQLRYALQPYLYTEARRTYDTGIAFLHPLYYDWPNSPEAYSSKGEYLFGDQLLVAPVVAPADKVSGLAEEDVWLPAGDWIEWPTGKFLNGPQKLVRRFSIDQIPVYVMAGTILPMQPPMEFTGEKPVDPLIISIWPLQPGTESSYSVYEDSGVSVDYQRGDFAKTPIKATQTGDTLRMEIGPVVGGFPGMINTRSYQIRLPADWPPEKVAINGASIQRANPTSKGGWYFEGNTLTTVIPVKSDSPESKAVVEVIRRSGLVARRSELDGFPGAMTRLRGSYDALQQIGPLALPPDELIDAMQSGDRLGYYPETVEEELDHFHQLLPQAQTAVNTRSRTFAQLMDEFAKRSGDNPRSSELDEQRKNRLEYMARAQKVVAEAGK